MKRIIAFLTFLTFSALAQEEYSLPKTPQRIEFANVIVNLDEQTHDDVEKLVISLLTPRNSYLDARLERMQWYFPYIEKVLEEEGVPDDFKYLCVQESGLEPDALSSSGAVGFWQFKEATGQELGLIINRDIDERKNILESTRAAATYFKKNNIIYKNWLSSMYAFNQGPTGAAKDIPEDWSYAGEVTFTSKTPPYLLKALAHRIAFEHRLNRLKNSPKTLLPYPTQNKSLAEVAVELTVDLSELRNHNKWLNAPRIPTGKDYVVLVPILREREQEIEDKITHRRDLISSDNGYPKLKRITTVTTSEEDPIFYEINGKRGLLAVAGDEAAQMAHKADMNILAFLKLNDLTDKDLIKTGQVYYLEKKDKKSTVEFHTASKGQTFWDVSQMYGIQLKKLLKMNRLKQPETLQPGRVVWLSKKRPKNQPVEIIQEIIEQPQQDIPVKEIYKKEVTEMPLDAAVSKADTEETEEEVSLPQLTKVEEKPQSRVIERTEKPAASKPLPAAPKEMPAETVPDAATHIVKQGETLFSLAKRYHLTVAELRALNNLGADDILQYNQKLIVSKTAARVVAPAKPEVVIKETKPAIETIKEKPATVKTSSTHQVEKGQTLYSISQLYGVTVNQLKAWNGLNDNTISIGQELIVGENKGSGVVTNGNNSYTVKPGDTLFSIAKRNGTTVSQVKAWNNLNSNTINVGQTLRVR